MDRIVAVSTYAFDGYPLETALDELARLGVRYVEPCGMDQVFEQLGEEDFCETRATWLARQLQARGQACLALSAHMDLTRSDSVARFRRRMEFAAAIGARYVNTTAGPSGGQEGFHRNIPDLVRIAEDLDLTINLENHGNLLDTGQPILDLIEAVGSPRVRLNYDTGNAWYYAKGALDPVSELAELASVVTHVHLKEPKLVEGTMRWVPLGDGVFDLPALGRVLQERLPGTPVAIELALRQRSREFEPRWRTPEIPPLPDVRVAIARSLRALSGILLAEEGRPAAPTG